MKIPIYQVAAFASGPFKGNPAAVCIVERWPSASLMQSIAAENNLAETAFLLVDGKNCHLRWFTPAVEIDLCGHGTLATAYVLMTYLQPTRNRAAFQTRSGVLIVEREGELLTMDFPARVAQPIAAHRLLEEALGKKPREVYLARDLLAIFDDEQTVRSLKPDQAKLASLEEGFGVIVSAPGDRADFVSRFFVPKAGIPEDPVTGSAHCTLVPYWAGRLGKDRLFALQVSARGGELHCELAGDRVKMSGKVVPFLQGEIELGDPVGES